MDRMSLAHVDIISLNELLSDLDSKQILNSTISPIIGFQYSCILGIIISLYRTKNMIFYTLSSTRIPIISGHTRNFHITTYFIHELAFTSFVIELQTCFVSLKSQLYQKRYHFFPYELITIFLHQLFILRISTLKKWLKTIRHCLLK